MKKNKLDNLFKRAYQIAELSHDKQTQVGCIAVREDGSEIASTFNGFIPNAPDNKLPNKRPKKYPYIIHAEQNLILQCAKHGVSLDNTKLITTLSPCIDCCRFLYTVGIKEIYFDKKYKDFDKQTNMDDLYLNVFKYKGFYKLLLESKKWR